MIEQDYLVTENVTSNPLHDGHRQVIFEVSRRLLADVIREQWEARMWRAHVASLDKTT